MLGGRARERRAAMAARFHEEQPTFNVVKVHEIAEFTERELVVRVRLFIEQQLNEHVVFRTMMMAVLG